MMWIFFIFAVLIMGVMIAGGITVLISAKDIAEILQACFLIVIGLGGIIAAVWTLLPSKPKHAKIVKLTRYNVPYHNYRLAKTYNNIRKSVEVVVEGKYKTYGCEDMVFYQLREGESYDLFIKNGIITGIKGWDEDDENGFDEDIDIEP